MFTAITAFLCLAFSGCVAVTNPVANGIPVRLLSKELLATPKEPLETIPLDWLRRPRPDTYRLAPDDILGVYIDGIMGPKEALPPVSDPEGDLPPAIGLPIPVREDGTIPLPLVKPINVEGLSIVEAENAIIEAYTVKRQILEPDRARILVSLLRPRTTRVLVVRQDSAAGSGRIDVTRGPLTRSGPAVTISGAERRGTGAVVDLPAYEDDVLTALTRTGGLPGLDAVNEVVIYRGSYRGNGSGVPQNGEQAAASAREITRIPLRILPGQPPPFEPEDIILKKGDIVFIERREAELFYTSGILPNREIPLPRDYDLDVVEAIIQTGGPLLNGRRSSNNLNGQLGDVGIGEPSPSLLTVLRRVPDGRQVAIRVDLNLALRDPRENILVQKGDILVLQESPQEAFTRYFTDITGFSFFGRWLNRTDAQGSATIVGP